MVYNSSCPECSHFGPHDFQDYDVKCLRCGHLTKTGEPPIPPSLTALPGPYSVDGNGWITSAFPGAYNDVVCCPHIDANYAEWHKPTLKLVLAAPELLEALKTLEELWEIQMRVSPSFPVGEEALKKAKAALAKAEGQ